ncbi:hypothetical protein [Thiothrix unzii]|uniref:Uncharacterized protein n=1 Tax=Thiothrix unzii TaxID=111769 RepID=A0A975F6E6_9GAMM|nr:hypothetical protein [Thiothrix unzii]QTR52017.1 hypothetical protein J9260_09640 [Thiothrix unzii]
MMTAIFYATAPHVEIGYNVFHSTVSLPFAAGDHKCIVVKIVDDCGIESLKVMELD